MKPDARRVLLRLGTHISRRLRFTMHRRPPVAAEISHRASASGQPDASTELARVAQESLKAFIGALTRRDAVEASTSQAQAGQVAGAPAPASLPEAIECALSVPMTDGSCLEEERIFSSPARGTVHMRDYADVQEIRGLQRSFGEDALTDEEDD